MGADLLAASANDQAGTDVSIAGFALPADGVYHIHVTARPDQPDSAGNYVISAGDATVHNYSLIPNQIQHGALYSPFAVDRWNRAWRTTRRWAGQPGHLVVRYETLGGHVISSLVRHNFSTGRGLAQFDWATPVSRAMGGLKFHTQISTGYGATLLDYNHRQWTAGIGVSFGD